jgi:Zn-dependent protease with chaperone function
MNPALMLCLVLLAVFGLTAVILSGLVALAWRAGLHRMLAAPGDLLTLRLLPVAGAALIVLGVVGPAFLRYEPHREHEPVGPVIVILAVFSLLTLGHGIWRGWRACAAARTLRKKCGPARSLMVADGQEVEVVEVSEPIVAVIGGWRSHVIAAECVISACSHEELQQVLAHEAAHVAARDNLKQLLLIASPDALAWTSLGATLLERWRVAAEYQADHRATGQDPRRRLALAAALIKLARLLGSAERTRLGLSMSVASDDVEGRVRQLLAAPNSSPTRTLKYVGVCALLTPLAALPLYGPLHELIEALVRLGS